MAAGVPLPGRPVDEPQEAEVVTLALDCVARARGQLRNNASCATSRLAPSAPVPETSRRASGERLGERHRLGNRLDGGHRCSPPRRPTVVVDLDQLAEHHFERGLFGRSELLEDVLGPGSDGALHAAE